MNQRIYDRIREIIETTPGLTQKGLAERMGLNPAAINRMLYGRRNIMVEEIPMIESYIGVKLDLSEIPTGAVEPLSEPWSQKVPVYGLTQGLDMSAQNVVDWVARHPAQMGIHNAFAIYAPSDLMEPRYFRGELVYIQPGRPVAAHRDCLVEMKHGVVLLRRLIRQEEAAVCVAQYHPPLETELLSSEIKGLYAVVGRG